MQNEHPPNDRRKLSPLKIASYAGFAVGAILLVCMLTFLLFPDPLVNGFIKPKIAKTFTEAYPAYSIRIADMNYSVLRDRFGSGTSRDARIRIQCGECVHTSTSLAREGTCLIS